MVSSSYPRETNTEGGPLTPEIEDSEKSKLVPLSMERPIGGEKAMRSGRILVVDDEEIIRVLHTIALAREGYEVDVAADGEQAWSALLRVEYDLVLTDHHMPKLTGAELLERMRKGGIRTPVIIVSGSIETAEIQQNQRLRISKVHHKLSPMSEILESVRQAVLLHKSGQNESRDGLDDSRPPLAEPRIVA